VRLRHKKKNRLIPFREMEAMYEERTKSTQTHSVGKMQSLWKFKSRGTYSYYSVLKGCEKYMFVYMLNYA
jgi:muconolactone delta-isomerase